MTSALLFRSLGKHPFPVVIASPGFTGLDTVEELPISHQAQGSCVTTNSLGLILKCNAMREKIKHCTRFEKKIIDQQTMFEMS
jgi:hypothetical protein